jgi:membrane protease YdiL (CAAX protease family)
VTESNERAGGFGWAVLFEGGLAILAVILAWTFGISLRSQFSADGVALCWAVARGLLASVPLLIAFVWIVHSSMPACRRIQQTVSWLVEELFPSRSLWEFALVSLLAGVGEELLFRGVLQRLFGEWLTAPFGLIVASLLFGAAHAVSALYFTVATLIGLYFGWLAMHYNDLVAPIAAHAFYDFIALAYIARLHRPTPNATNEAPRPPDEHADD